MVKFVAGVIVGLVVGFVLFEDAPAPPPPSLPAVEATNEFDYLTPTGRQQVQSAQCITIRVERYRGPVEESGFLNWRGMTTLAWLGFHPTLIEVR